MSDLQIRKHIEVGAQEGNGACLIAFAVLELARVQEALTADPVDGAGVGGKIAKAVELCADRLAELADTIMCK